MLFFYAVKLRGFEKRERPARPERVAKLDDETADEKGPLQCTSVEFLPEPTGVRAGRRASLQRRKI